MAPSNNSSRSSYSNKFKLMAVSMADELGCFAEAARSLGINDVGTQWFVLVWPTVAS